MLVLKPRSKFQPGLVWRTGSPRRRAALRQASIRPTAAVTRWATTACGVSCKCSRAAAAATPLPLALAARTIWPAGLGRAPPGGFSAGRIAADAEAAVTPLANSHEIERAHVIARTVGQRRDRHAGGVSILMGMLEGQALGSRLRRRYVETMALTEAVCPSCAHRGYVAATALGRVLVCLACGRARLFCGGGQTVRGLARFDSVDDTDDHDSPSPTIEGRCVEDSYAAPPKRGPQARRLRGPRKRVLTPRVPETV